MTTVRTLIVDDEPLRWQAPVGLVVSLPYRSART